jgi:hypothetical protein
LLTFCQGYPQITILPSCMKHWAQLLSSFTCQESDFSGDELYLVEVEGGLLISWFLVSCLNHLCVPFVSSHPPVQDLFVCMLSFN